MIPQSLTFSQPPSLEVYNKSIKNNGDHTPVTEGLLSRTMNNPLAIVEDLDAQACVGERLKEIRRRKL